MSIRDLAQFAQEIIAGQLGEAATWIFANGAASKVAQVLPVADRDAELQPFGRGVVVPQRLFKVLVSEIATPAVGDRFTLPSGRVMEIVADPRREDAVGCMWTLPTKEIDP